MTDFWLRDSLYRDTAPVPIYQHSATETAFPATYQLCTATRVMLNKICTRPDSYREAKTRAIRQLAEHNLPLLPGRYKQGGWPFLK
jgi:hypothetical protein